MKKKKLSTKVKRMKCKYGGCLHPKALPVEKPRYCEKHLGKAEALRSQQLINLSKARKSKYVPLLQRIKSLILVTP